MDKDLGPTLPVNCAKLSQRYLVTLLPTADLVYAFLPTGLSL